MSNFSQSRPPEPRNFAESVAKRKEKWYRGQSNFKWDLIPSFFRGINKKGVTQIDLNRIYDDYSDFGLIDKAAQTIGYSRIDYNFLSFMQHAVSFSPLIDFTSDPVVATVMGLSDTDNFRERNCSL